MGQWLRNATSGHLAAPLALNASDEPRPYTYTRRSTISFFSSAMALAGFRPLGHTRAQFRMVWQR